MSEENYKFLKISEDGKKPTCVYHKFPSHLEILVQNFQIKDVKLKNY